MQLEAIGLWGLFFSAFISATIAPGGSEAVLAYMVTNQPIDIKILVLVATIGNTLGSLTTWLLGILAAKKIATENFLSKKKQKSLNLVKRWGKWSLLFAWLPIVGDGLCFAAGWLNLPFWTSCLLILIGKALRYILIAYVFI